MATPTTNKGEEGTPVEQPASSVENIVGGPEAEPSLTPEIAKEEIQSTRTNLDAAVETTVGIAGDLQDPAAKAEVEKASEPFVDEISKIEAEITASLGRQLSRTELDSLSPEDRKKKLNEYRQGEVQRAAAAGEISHAQLANERREALDQLRDVERGSFEEPLVRGKTPEGKEWVKGLSDPLAKDERFLAPHQAQAAVDLVLAGMQSKLDKTSNKNKDTYTELLSVIGELKKEEAGVALDPAEKEKLRKRQNELMKVVDEVLARPGDEQNPNALTESGVDYEQLSNKPEIATKIFLEAAQRFQDEIPGQLQALEQKEKAAGLTTMEREKKRRLEKMRDTYGSFDFVGGKPQELFPAGTPKGTITNLNEQEAEQLSGMATRDSLPDGFEEEPALQGDFIPQFTDEERENFDQEVEASQERFRNATDTDNQETVPSQILRGVNQAIDTVLHPLGGPDADADVDEAVEEEADIEEEVNPELADAREADVLALKALEDWVNRREPGEKVSITGAIKKAAVETARTIKNLDEEVAREGMIGLFKRVSEYHIENEAGSAEQTLADYRMDEDLEKFLNDPANAAGRELLLDALETRREYAHTKSAAAAAAYAEANAKFDWANATDTEIEEQKLKMDKEIFEQFGIGEYEGQQRIRARLIEEQRGPDSLPLKALKGVLGGGWRWWNRRGKLTKSALTVGLGLGMWSLGTVATGGTLAVGSAVWRAVRIFGTREATVSASTRAGAWRERKFEEKQRPELDKFIAQEQGYIDSSMRVFGMSMEGGDERYQALLMEQATKNYESIKMDEAAFEKRKNTAKMIGSITAGLAVGGLSFATMTYGPALAEWIGIPKPSSSVVTLGESKPSGAVNPPGGTKVIPGQTSGKSGIVTENPAAKAAETGTKMTNVERLAANQGYQVGKGGSIWEGVREQVKHHVVASDAASPETLGVNMKPEQFAAFKADMASGTMSPESKQILDRIVAGAITKNQMMTMGISNPDQVVVWKPGAGGGTIEFTGDSKTPIYDMRTGKAVSLDNLPQERPSAPSTIDYTQTRTSGTVANATQQGTAPRMTSVESAPATVAETGQAVASEGIENDDWWKTGLTESQVRRALPLFDEFKRATGIDLDEPLGTGDLNVKTLYDTVPPGSTTPVRIVMETPQGAKGVMVSPELARIRSSIVPTPDEQTGDVRTFIKSRIAAKGSSVLVEPPKASPNVVNLKAPDTTPIPKPPTNP